MNSIMEAREKKKLSFCQRHDIVTRTEKKDKDKRFIKN